MRRCGARGVRSPDCQGRVLECYRSQERTQHGYREIIIHNGNNTEVSTSTVWWSMNIWFGQNHATEQAFVFLLLLMYIFCTMSFFCLLKKLECWVFWVFKSQYIKQIKIDFCLVGIVMAARQQDSIMRTDTRPDCWWGKRSQNGIVVTDECWPCDCVAVSGLITTASNC